MWVVIIFNQWMTIGSSTLLLWYYKSNYILSTVMWHDLFIQPVSWANWVLESPHGCTWTGRWPPNSTTYTTLDLPIELILLWRNWKRLPSFFGCTENIVGITCNLNVKSTVKPELHEIEFNCFIIINMATLAPIFVRVPDISAGTRRRMSRMSSSSSSRKREVCEL